MTLDECLHELRQEDAVRAATSSDFSESAFADVVTGYLIDAGAIDGFEACHFRHRGMRIDGTYFNIEDESTLDVFVVEVRDEAKVATLTKTECDDIFGRAESFVQKALTARFAEGLETSSPAHSVARAIVEQASTIRRIRYFLLTNSQLSSKVRQIPQRVEDGREWTYRVWDLASLCPLMSTGEPEDVVVDFVEMFGAALPCLPANQGSTVVTSYLTVIPGTWLAEIYDQYGGRLLEQNVRTFLQNKGKVNRGIQKTIVDEPSLFFAFNNGISATATFADVETQGGIAQLRSVKKLQIVNGGQTTASIFNVAKRIKMTQLDSIRVQMKLSVIDPPAVDEIVPKISRFANTQNRISDADLFSTHPFHVRVEGLSRQVAAPPVGGSQIQTYWVYERARGQYVNSQAYLSAGKQKEFRIRFPRSQVITKTDLAKVINTFGRKPDIVSRGAQKNFAEFAGLIGGRDQWKSRQESFNAAWYKQVVAQTIVFQSTERLVQEADWYEQGYRANVVTYALALLSERLAAKKMELNWERIWQRQAIGEGVRASIDAVGKEVLQRIVVAATENRIANVTEWCKKQACWIDICDKVSLKITLPDAEVISSDEATEALRGAKGEQKNVNEAEALIRVDSQGAAYWQRLFDWARTADAGIASAADLDILKIASRYPSKVPTGPQSTRLIAIEERAISEGFK